MNVSPDKKDIEDIAIELGTEPVFLEKDWHVTLIIQGLSKIQDEHFLCVFCGGTSLLQGHRLIKRFSEDVDFRIVPKGGKSQNRTTKRAFREKLLEELSKIPELSLLVETVMSRDSGNFFSARFKYENRFGDHHSLRPEIKLDGTFVGSVLPGSEVISIKPIVADYLSMPGIPMTCLSLLETTSDKASALIWRVLGRNRNDQDDDLTMIRHLHDLHPLLHRQEGNFESLSVHLEATYLQDYKRGGNIPANISIAAARALHVLETDTQYRSEYENFVINMCFGPQDEQISFSMAWEQFKKLVAHLLLFPIQK